jgi:hypothetical protein
MANKRNIHAGFIEALKKAAKSLSGNYRLDVETDCNDIAVFLLEGNSRVRGARFSLDATKGISPQGAIDKAKILFGNDLPPVLQNYFEQQRGHTTAKTNKSIKAKKHHSKKPTLKPLPKGTSPGDTSAPRKRFVYTGPDGKETIAAAPVQKPTPKGEKRPLLPTPMEKVAVERKPPRLSQAERSRRLDDILKKAETAKPTPKPEPPVPPQQTNIATASADAQAAAKPVSPKAKSPSARHTDQRLGNDAHPVMDLSSEHNYSGASFGFEPSSPQRPTGPSRTKVAFPKPDKI